MKRTPLYDRHVALGARLMEFGGWDMPLQYPTGIMEEHLLTRRAAGLFDVSHMGRFSVAGKGGLAFLQGALSNNAAALEPGKAQYTMIPNEEGGAIDDAYLYCTGAHEYLLVVNAANRDRDWRHLRALLRDYPGVELLDRTEEIAMLSLQGPRSRAVLLEALPERCLPDPGRNTLCPARLHGVEVILARTGYAGEALGFELFLPAEACSPIWDWLLERGASPVGLGARDTLRLEAGLPLYGHELGRDPEGREIPIFACSLARFAVSFSPLKGSFVGRAALERQFEAWRRIQRRDYADRTALPRLIRLLVLTGPGVARQGTAVFLPGGTTAVGVVTSGTVAPYWVFEGEGLESLMTEASGRRAIALALLESSIQENTPLEVEIRGRRVGALCVPILLRAEAPPFARAVLYEAPQPAEAETRARVGTPERGREASAPSAAARVELLLRQAVENTRWRQEQCFNLIPSEMTLSPMVRLLSVMDPAFRYAEHRRVKALREAEVFYYQGTRFIEEVEQRLAAELRAFLGCRQAETRVISGQMANMVVFSALVDYLNRDNRKAEPRRLKSVLHNHILRGGHLSAQPMGALRDFVARDPATEAPAVTSLPVMPEDPYRPDLSRLPEVLERSRPELIILGKSMILYREPVAEVRRLVSEMGLDSLVMYDMAHVLGLAGPRFQEPFREGADVVTASTHKTFFGTQRGLVAADIAEGEPRYAFWETIERRTFPGSVSNHHLGTLLGLLLAVWEMNAFRDEYQGQVIANAKAFARALNKEGLAVAGDPALGHTETHQVVVEVGYAQGIEAARALEQNNIIVNYQATPLEEGFTAAGALRLGVSEMTRFGMKEADFAKLAHLLAAVVGEGRAVREEVVRLREGFRDLHYCFSGPQFETQLQELHALI
jgi:aminomethyltransferase